MDPEERELLERIADRTDENNKILRGMRRSHRITSIFQIAYYIILIGAAIGLYYYLQPYVDPFIHAYGNLKTGIDQLQHFGQATST